MEDWQIVFAIVVPILAVVIPLLVHFNNVNRINKVHGDVRLLLDHALRKKSDGSAKD